MRQCRSGNSRRQRNPGGLSCLVRTSVWYRPGASKLGWLKLRRPGHHLYPQVHAWLPRQLELHLGACVGRSDVSTNPGTPFNLCGARQYQSNPNCLRCQNYGNGDGDARHNLTANYVWELPFKSSNRFLDEAIGGWTVAGTFFAHSGLPWTRSNFAQAVDGALTLGAFPLLNLRSPGGGLSAFARWPVWDGPGGHCYPRRPAFRRRISRRLHRPVMEIAAISSVVWDISTPISTSTRVLPLRSALKLRTWRELLQHLQPSELWSAESICVLGGSLAKCAALA